MKKIAKKKRKIAKNYELEYLLIEILKDAPSEGLSAREILNSLKVKGFKCSRRSVYNHIDTDKFQAVGTEKMPEKFVLNKRAIREFKVGLTPLEAQIVIWALENLKSSSTDFFYESTADTVTKIHKALPEADWDRIKNSLDVFSHFSGIAKRPFTFEKNNLEALLSAIREQKWIRAKLKDSKLSYRDRHHMRKLAIGSFTFKNNIPYVIAKDVSETDPKNIYKSLRATRLNSIEVLDETISEEELEFMRDFDLHHNAEKIKIVARSILAQIFKESVISPSQRTLEKKKTEDELIVEVEFNMRITNSFTNLLLPHVRDIISIQPKHLLDELKRRCEENVKNIRRLC